MKKPDPKRLYGKYAGTVFSNQDPDKRGRIKAYVPKAGFTVDGAGTTAWALPSTEHAGQWLGPEVNTKVWIEFEAGDPNIPIWSGAFFGAPAGQSELPLRAQGTDDGTDAAKGADTFTTVGAGVKNQPATPFVGLYPFVNILKLSNGITVEYDNTKGAERVLLIHPSGTFVEMQADGKLVMKSNDDFWKTIGNDLLEHVIANLFQNVGGNVDKNIVGNEDKAVGGNSTETVTGVKEIEGATIKLGNGATLTLLTSSAINKYNIHKHPDPVSGSTGVPDTLLVVGTDDTTKTLAE